MAEDLNYTPRLQQQYNEVIQKELLSNLNLRNIFEVPKISKIVINPDIESGGAGNLKKFYEPFEKKKDNETNASSV